MRTGTFGLAENLHPTIDRHKASLDRESGLAFVHLFAEFGECGAMRFEVMLVPGHSPGSVLFYDANAGLLLGGDLVFFDSIGRFDLPGGSAEELVKSVVRRFLALPDTVRVLPGHGPETTIGR